jgi:ubiquinone/menaquinone biosynthesis C-methylase UbiE
MGIYQGRHAELYDLLYSQKPYAAEAAFVHDALQRYSQGPAKRLLDIACGTGSHAIELERYGYEIVAADIADDMLACARAKAGKASSRVRFERQDMRELDLEQTGFDAALCLFDAIGHVLTTAAVRETFAGVWRHLRPGALFILEFWHAASIMSKYEPLRVRRFRAERGEILRLSETTLDLKQQNASVQHSIYELRTDGTYSVAVETQANRFFALPEMRDLLHSANFDIVKCFSGFSHEETLTRDTWHIVLIVRRLEG